METNYKGKFNLDHIYCHPSERPNYIRMNNAGYSPNSDMIALIQENEHIRAMLFLHLELLEQQNDKLTSTQKLVFSLKEENQSLRAKCERLERRLQQQQQQQKPGKAEKEKATSRLANNKINTVCIATEDIKSEEDAADDDNINKSPSATEALTTNGDGSSIIGESNGKLISKIILHRIQLPIEGQQAVAAAAAAAESIPSSVTTTTTTTAAHDLLDAMSAGCKAPKMMKKSHETKIDSDESLSCDSMMIDHEQKHTKTKQRRPLLMTNRQYSTREWEDEEFSEEFNIEEAEALKSDEPMLETPKWVVKEFTGLYSIEGTEDLSDETFLKRHAKLEHDEKKRKKWDVQRIREQKNIEKLKRRHCKDELQDMENREILSFYPYPDAVKFVQIVDDLPVQAFGEGIPQLTGSNFALPWMQGSPSIRASDRHCNANQFSSFVYLKKRRRPQALSSSLGKQRMSAKISQIPTIQPCSTTNTKSTTEQPISNLAGPNPISAGTKN